MKALIFDTETTGLVENRTLKLDRQPEIIEFYGCVVDLETGEVSKELDLLIKPTKPIPAEITRIVDIDNAMVETAPPFRDIANQIFDLIAEAPAVIAHNLSFDCDMVEIEFERLGDKIAWPHKICTVEQTIHLKGYRLKLTDLHQHLFGEPFAGAHRAKVDVQALVRCCLELTKRGLL